MQTDAITICHLPSLFGSTALGWVIGWLQFIPWFFGPLLFLKGAFVWTWRQELFASLLLFADKVLFVLSSAAQIRFNVSIPDPSCTDIFGTQHGFPCIAALRLGFYLGVAFQFHYWRWKYHHQHTPWLVWITMIGTLVLTVVGLLANGLNTFNQVFCSLLIGMNLIAPGFMLLIRTLLYPYFVMKMVADHPPLLQSIFGAHDHLLHHALPPQSSTPTHA